MGHDNGLEERAAEAVDLAAEFLYPADPSRVEEFVSVFGHATNKDAPPYESHYGTAHTFQQSQMLADLAGFYRAFGVKARPGIERVDHVSTELEFLAYLMMKEAEVDEARAAVCRDARRSFVRDHLATWIPAFTTRLRARTDGTYGRAAERLHAFVSGECESLGLERPAGVAGNVTFPEWTPETEPPGCAVAPPQEEFEC